MRFFCWSNQKIHSDETLSLSDQVARRWLIYTTTHNPHAKREARDFLIETFGLYAKQPEEVMEQKIQTLISLKCETREKDFIPTYELLPDDSDTETIEKIEHYKSKCQQMIVKISHCAVGPEDSVIQQYVDAKTAEARGVKLLEKSARLLAELTNVYYGIKRDTITNDIRSAMRAELNELAEHRNQEPDYLEKVNNTHEKYAKMLDGYSIQVRSTRYRELTEPMSSRSFTV